MSNSVTALLLERVNSSPSLPLVTVVSDVGRVELSAATLGTWVAKTAGLLRDELLLDAGATVDVELPLGWQSMAWVHAIWRAGMVLGMGVPADVAVRDELAVVPPQASEVVVVGRHPLGMPMKPAPTSALEWSLAARSMPDRFSGPVVAPEAVALTSEARTLSHADIVTLGRDLAARWAVGSDARVLVDIAHPPVDAWLGSAVVPLVVGGSVLIWTASRPPTGTDLESEGVTSVAR